MNISFNRVSCSAEMSSPRRSTIARICRLPAAVKNPCFVKLCQYGIRKYKELLSEYNKKIIKRKRIESADTLLLTVNARAVRNLSTECRNLYSSVAVLAAYASGQVCCTPASMMLMVENVNKSLDRIKEIVNAAYFQTWKFIKARTSYWKGELYRSKTIREMAGEALGRWKGAGKLGY